MICLKLSWSMANKNYILNEISSQYEYTISLLKDEGGEGKKNGILIIDCNKQKKRNLAHSVDI